MSVLSAGSFEVALASELSINPNTVQRAYVELERRGFIYSIKGKGNFAADPKHIRLARLEDVGAELDAALRKAAAHGMREDEVLDRVRAVFSDTADSGKTGQTAAKEKPGQKAEQMTGGKNDDSDN